MTLRLLVGLAEWFGNFLEDFMKIGDIHSKLVHPNGYPQSLVELHLETT